MSSFCQGFQVEQAQMWEQALPALRKDSSLHELCAPAKPKLLHLLLVSLEHGLRLRTCLQNTTHKYHKLSSQQYALSFIYIFTTWYSTVKNNRIYVIITNFSLLCNSIYRPSSSNAAHSSVTHLKKIKIRQHIWNYIERGKKIIAPLKHTAFTKEHLTWHLEQLQKQSAGLLYRCLGSCSLDKEMVFHAVKIILAFWWRRKKAA